MASWRQKIGNVIAGKTITAAQWFLNWAQIANNEDMQDPVTLENAYSNVAWLNIAISCRARNLSRAVFELYNGDTEIESGPVFDLFNHGLSGRTRYEIWEETEGWRCIRGEAIWILGWGGQKGFPRQIVIVDPALMKSKIDEATRQISMWYYKKGALEVPFKPEEVIHFPMWGPDDDYRGPNQIIPIKEEVATERQAARSGSRLLADNSIPGGVISIPGDSLSAKEADAVIENWEAKHRGPRNAGRIAVLGSGATYQRISLTPSEMMSFDMRQWNRDTILAKYGVPHAVVGVSKSGGTLAGKDTMEQMRSFWTTTLIPELRYFEDKLAHDFFGRFNLDMVGEFQTDDIEELQADQETLSARVREEVKLGLLTINEGREILHNEMDPVEWGDTWWQYGIVTDVSAPPPEPVTSPPASTAPPPKLIDSLFESPVAKEVKAKHIYTPQYKAKHWEMALKAWDRLEGGYAKAVKSWIFEIRQAHLHTLMENGFTQAIQHSIMEELTGEPMWNEYGKKLEKVSRPFLTRAVDEAGAQLNSVFTDLGILGGRSFNIWDTRAVDLLEYRLNKGSLTQVAPNVRLEIMGKLQDGIRGGYTENEMADSLRGVYNIVSNRASTIARTEIGGAINDSRIAGFKEEGFAEHEWLSAQDERVREQHQIDGEVVQIGQKFSNGLRYPNDPDGDAGNVINCRCLSLPVFGEQAVAASIPAPVKKAEEIPPAPPQPPIPQFPQEIHIHMPHIEPTKELASVVVNVPKNGGGKVKYEMVKDENGELKAVIRENVDGN